MGKNTKKNGARVGRPRKTIPGVPSTTSAATAELPPKTPPPPTSTKNLGMQGIPGVAREEWPTLTDGPPPLPPATATTTAEPPPPPTASAIQEIPTEPIAADVTFSEVVRRRRRQQPHQQPQPPIREEPPPRPPPRKRPPPPRPPPRKGPPPPTGARGPTPPPRPIPDPSGPIDALPPSVQLAHLSNQVSQLQTALAGSSGLVLEMNRRVQHESNRVRTLEARLASRNGQAATRRIANRSAWPRGRGDAAWPRGRGDAAWPRGRGDAARPGAQLEPVPQWPGHWGTQIWPPTGPPPNFWAQAPQPWPPMGPWPLSGGPPAPLPFTTQNAYWPSQYPFYR